MSLSSGHEPTFNQGSDIREKGTCNVCDEKAFYNFYGTLACDSCRTFFRRHVLQNKILVCDFNNVCDINPKTRKECSKCRLVKCLKVGMRMELVAPNEQLRIRRGRSTDFEKLESRTRAILGDPMAAIKALPLQPSNLPLISPSSASNGQINTFHVKSKFLSIATILRAPEKPVMPFDPRLAYKPNDLFGRLGPKLRLVPSTATLTEIPQSQALTAQRGISSRFQSDNCSACTVPPVIFKRAPFINNMAEVPSSPLIHWTRDRESTRRFILPCDYLMKEMVIIAHELVSKGLEIESERAEMVAAAKLLCFGIERLVKACQLLTPFRKLSDADQVALLRGGCSEMLLLRSAYHSNLVHDCWEFSARRSDGEMTKTRLSISVLKNLRDGCCVDMNYRHFVLSIDEKWRKDNVLLTILNTIVLFSPHRNNIVDKESIKLNQCLYCHLLKGYLESKCGPTEANVNYIRLNAWLNRLKTLREDYESMILDVSATEVGLLHGSFGELCI